MWWCWAPAPRSATPAGPTRAAPTTPATASSRSTTSTPSSPSSRSVAAACTASAGAIRPTGNPVRPENTPTALDQQIGVGNGTAAIFQLTKTYGSAFNPWTRDIKKPVAGTVLVAVNGVLQTPATAYTADPDTGLVVFLAGHIPAAGHAITAGFEFDVPVRFDTDKLEINIQGFRHGAIPSIPIVEIRLCETGLTPGEVVSVGRSVGLAFHDSTSRFSRLPLTTARLTTRPSHP